MVHGCTYQSIYVHSVWLHVILIESKTKIHGSATTSVKQLILDCSLAKASQELMILQHFLNINLDFVDICHLCQIPGIRSSVQLWRGLNRMFPRSPQFRGSHPTLLCGPGLSWNTLKVGSALEDNTPMTSAVSHSRWRLRSQKKCYRLLKFRENRKQGWRGLETTS